MNDWDWIEISGILVFIFNVIYVITGLTLEGYLPLPTDTSLVIHAKLLWFYIPPLLLHAWFGLKIFARRHKIFMRKKHKKNR